MAKPIQVINQPVFTEEQIEQQKLEQLIKDIANHAEGIQQTVKLLQELHESGILEAVTALIEAKEKVANILVGQALRPNVTRTINNVMSVAGVLGDIDPEMTKKLLSGVSKGLQKASADLDSGKKTGIFDLVKLLKNPNTNRTITFGLGLLTGLGEGLKE